ncbi:MAG: hypothetical protein FJ290_18935 [Planctomycetes bacterium]|nr:hypothetical protein [Planctomycetota bacterium]
MVIGLSVAEVALALLVAWLLTRSGVPRHASRSVDVGAGDVFILVALLSCLGLFVFVLAFWQWRLAGRDRVRVLLACYLSLAMAFLGLCWYDVSVQSGELAGAPTTVRRVIEQTAASGLTLGALLAGLSALAVILRAARKSLKPATPGDIVGEGSGDPSRGRETLR